MATGAGTKDDPWVLKTPPGHVRLHDVPRRGGRPADDRLPGRRDEAAATTPGRSRTCTRCSRRTATGCRSAATDEQKPAPEGTVEAWGRSESQPGRRLVRAEEGPARPVRRLHAAAPRGARAGRGHPRREEQQDAGDLRRCPTMRGRPPPAGDPFEALGDPEPPGDRRAARRGRTVGPGARRRPADQPAGRLAPPAPPEAGRARRRGAARDAPHLPAPRRGRRGRPGLPRAGLGRGRGAVPARRREHRRRAARAVIEPIRLAFEVDCPVDHAFDVWTAGIDQWWPADHTVSAEAGPDGRPRGAARRPDLRADGRPASSTTGAR